MSTVTPPEQTEADPDTDYMSMSQAAEELSLNRTYLKGYAQAIGIRLIRSRASLLLMTRRDFERLRQSIARDQGTLIP